MAPPSVPRGTSSSPLVLTTLASILEISNISPFLLSMLRMATPPPSLGNVSSAWDWGGASVLRHSIALRSNQSLSKLLTPHFGELGALSIVDGGAN